MPQVFPFSMWGKRPCLSPLTLLIFLWFIPNITAADPLSTALDAQLNAPALSGGISGVVVERVSDGQMTYSHNPDIRLMPASNRKLFTSAAVLGLLGDDYTFETQVLSKSHPDALGTLHADLYVRGVGDSALTLQDFDAMAKSLYASGVKKIVGRICGDGSAFTDGPYGIGWGWDYLADDYAAKIAGLEVNKGVVKVLAVAGGAVGDPVHYHLDPPNTSIAVINSARSAVASGPNTCVITRPWDKNYLTVEGSLPLGSSAKNSVAVGDPVQFAADLFRNALAANGIQIDGRACAGTTPPDANIVLASHKSLPMSQYIALMNKPSDNLIAESLLHVIGLKTSGKGTYDAGDAVEMPFFKSIGVDTEPIKLADGSGVSRRDYVTARAVGQLLLAMTKRTDWPQYYDSLPIAGVDGTLRKRMVGTIARGNVHAKTGTVGEVSCLSGYFTGKSGDKYLFSILLNNFSGEGDGARSVQDSMLGILVNSL